MRFPRTQPNRSHPLVPGMRAWFKAMPNGIFQDILGGIRTFNTGSPSRSGLIKPRGLGTLYLPTTSDSLFTDERAYLRPTNRLSVSAWCRWTGATMSSYATICDYVARSGANTPYHAYKLGVNHLSGTANAYTMEFGVSTSNTAVLATSNVASTTDFDHIAMTWGGNTSNNAIKAYVNGVEGASNNATSIYYDDDTATNNFFIGGGFPGWIDDIMIWDRWITATEIKQLYALGKLGYEPLLAHKLTFDARARNGSFMAGITSCFHP